MSITINPSEKSVTISIGTLSEILMEIEALEESSISEDHFSPLAAVITCTSMRRLRDLLSLGGGIVRHDKFKPKEG